VLNIPVPQGRFRFALQAYLDDTTDSRLPAHLAMGSKLPHAHTFKTRSCYGVPYPSNGTSMLLSGNDSLAALSTISSATTLESISTPVGEREIEHSRLLLEGEYGALVVPALRSQVMFECPFNFLSCHQTFSGLNEWFNHSVSHFSAIGPPAHSSCCFCDAEFDGNDGLQSWAERMQHVAFHYQLGCRLAHARPDFALNKYLWRNFLISDATYRDIMVDNGNYSLPEESSRYHSASCATPQIYTNSVSSIKSRQERIRRRRTSRGHAIA